MDSRVERKMRMMKTDGELLAAFVEGDEAAFSELMTRHRRVVLGVCRRILGGAGECEDAAQAAFIILARKAPGLTRRASILGWLHRTARHVALRAARNAHLRLEREREAGEAMQTEMSDTGSSVQSGMLGVLDKALDRLPERFRVPVVLHHLEARTQAEVADMLGLNPGTVASRLNRGRALLRRRLARHGVALTMPGLLALLQTEAEAAAMGGSLVAAPLEGSSAATLAAEVIRHGLISKVAVISATSLLTLGVISVILTQGRIRGQETVRSTQSVPVAPDGPASGSVGKSVRSVHGQPMRTVVRAPAGVETCRVLSYTVASDDYSLITHETADIAQADAWTGEVCRVVLEAPDLHITMTDATMRLDLDFITGDRERFETDHRQLGQRLAELPDIPRDVVFGPLPFRGDITVLMAQTAPEGVLYLIVLRKIVGTKPEGPGSIR